MVKNMSEEPIDITTKGELVIEQDEFEFFDIRVNERQKSSEFVTDKRVVAILDILKELKGKEVVIRIKEVDRDGKEEVPKLQEQSVPDRRDGDGTESELQQMPKDSISRSEEEHQE